MTALSKEKNIPITMHCLEVAQDTAFFKFRGHSGMSYCESVGLLGPSTVLVHMAHLVDSDIEKLAETGTHVAHCPTSNAKLASGLCRVVDLQKSHVNVGLGTDGGTHLTPFLLTPCPVLATLTNQDLAQPLATTHATSSAKCTLLRSSTSPPTKTQPSYPQ